ncbi:L-asparaginase II [Rubidibacter lacunae KORDI 51-2]|uniref:L-asparaginase II n=1 Tax=Rubidibacter lacunae KORDI 51-2 TaxID=582515 RepID=U5DRU9_9CHRO|nr:asparaginase [Rubidibacter lacunae]ERN42415.1 L-asparaginase II [Rubidibacter lacunae KORDI 51-2]
MSRGKRTHTPEIEVRLLRDGIVESIHRVCALVCDNRGRVLSLAGQSEAFAFARSALKPFQAMPVTITGALERYGLGDRDLAIVCSSHQGSIEQARQAFNILWRADIDPSALQCPIPPGARNALKHNCSGKHAGMLTVCQQRGWPLGTYLRPTHPIQQLILSQIAEQLQMPGEEFISARDDCGAPTYCMQLAQLATLYARLAAGDNLYLERIARAMTHYPELIGGDSTFDTEVMRATGGNLISKAGSEGIQCIGRAGEGMGLAIKVVDGAKRAKYAAAIHLLRQLGWITPAASESLADRFIVFGPHKRLEVVGELEML